MTQTLYANMNKKIIKIYIKKKKNKTNLGLGVNRLNDSYDNYVKEK
jgi:hypothetical protein